MSIIDTQIELGSDNVYADIGMQDAEAMRFKAKLSSKIAEIIKQRNLTQNEAGAIVEMPQSKLSNMLRGQFRGISEFKMLHCLNKLGQDIEIVVKKAPLNESIGKISIIFA
jgi:predicted XRE-type DNA-binding protein